MVKININKKKLKDLLIDQLQMLRIRLVQNIADIDKYIEEIEKRLKNAGNNY